MSNTNIYFMSKMNLSLGRMITNINEVHECTSKNKISILGDMVFCACKYGTGYWEYRVYEYYNLNKEQRNTYLTRIKNNKVVRLKNDKDYYHCFKRKDEFAARFNKYLKRDWLLIEKTDLSKFTKFMENKDDIMMKPMSASGGKGIEKLAKSNFANIEEMYSYIKDKGSVIVEEMIVQHEAVNALNPYSVSSIRIVTILDKGAVNVVYAFIRMGNADKPVDNLSSGGMCAPINIKTGEIMYPAYDKQKNIYYNHPVTGNKIQGFVIPNWDKVLETVNETATIVPQIQYVGWDIAITSTGCCIIEGNHLPSNGILQMPPHVPDKIGMLPEFRKYVKGI